MQGSPEVSADTCFGQGVAGLVELCSGEGCITIPGPEHSQNIFDLWGGLKSCALGKTCRVFF